jgi:hypothetical protein
MNTTERNGNGHHVHGMNIPQTVAIVALGASNRTYLMQTIEAGGRWRVWDEVWAINVMGGVI